MNNVILLGVEQLIPLIMTKLNVISISISDFTSVCEKMSKKLCNKNIYITCSKNNTELFIEQHPECFEMSSDSSFITRKVSNSTLISHFIAYIPTDILKSIESTNIFDGEKTHTEISKKYQHKNAVYEIYCLCKNAFDCNQDMVVYSNVENTKDFPAGTKWVCPLVYFKSHFKEVN